MEFLLLGPLVVRDDAGRELSLPSRKQRALVSVLALSAGGVVSSERLLEVLWPEGAPATAATALQGHVSRLRKLFGAERLVTQAPGYRLQLAPGELDLGRFEGLLAEARCVGEPELRAERLAAALALWRGPALAEFEAEAFAQAELERLGDLRLAALEERLEAELELGRASAVLPELEALVAAHRYRERLRGLLMLALYRAGRQAEALAVYRTGRELLVGELGIEPSPELQRLERQILGQDAALAPGAAGSRVALPRGTVTFLFTDVEGSTRLLQGLGAERYAEELGRHRRAVREAFAAQGGVEVDTQGDSFFYAFARASEALAAAAAAQHALDGSVLPLRVGVHTGEPLLTGDGYVGVDVHRAARIAAAGHGGQILVSQSTRDLLEDEPLRDLGEHRLKDLTRAERIYQLGEQEFPPLQSLNRTNLPVASWPLVGRERELAELIELLCDGSRLVTVTGTGGTGKTRLALQAAADLIDEFVDGVFFVPLAPLRDPALVSPTIAQAAGVRSVAALQSARALLLLDNFEHLIVAAPEATALLERSPELRMLATSRAPLRVRSEREYPIEPLREEDAVVFFAERAGATGRAVEPDETVSAICRRLDNLPLALELAAARVRALDPPTLLARLEQRLPLLTRGARDAPERQQTLRATIKWSHGLLDAHAQQLFARLAVFAGSFSLEAAEQVCDAGLDQLDALVELNLLKPIGDGRFLMLETIREYAAGRLEIVGEEAELRARHGRFFLELAVALFEPVREYGVSIQVARAAADLDNIRAALDWACTSDEPELVMNAVGALASFWNVRGGDAEALRALEHSYHEDGPASLRFGALRSLFILRGDAGDREGAERAARRHLELAREVGDTDQVARALNSLGFSAWERGESERAAAFFRKAAALVPGFSANLALLLLDCGELEAAEGIFRNLLSEAEAEGHTVAVAVARMSLAWTLRQRGRRPDAAELLRRSLPTLGSIGGRFLAYALGLAAEFAGERGCSEDAARLLGAATAAFDAHVLPFAQRHAELAAVATSALLDDADYKRFLAEGRKLDSQAAVELALTILE